MEDKKLHVWNSQEHGCEWTSSDMIGIVSDLCWIIDVLCSSRNMKQGITETVKIYSLI